MKEFMLVKNGNDCKVPWRVSSRNHSLDFFACQNKWFFDFVQYDPGNLVRELTLVLSEFEPAIESL